MPYDVNDIKYRGANKGGQPTQATSNIGDSDHKNVTVIQHRRDKKHILRIGTRSSPLAMAQALDVKHRLEQHHHILPVTCEIIKIETSGDKFLSSTLQDIGGKGLFTKEIEQALLDKHIDIAVHSMKDVPTMRQNGLEIFAVLPRQDARDCFISVKYKNFNDLPMGAVVGTASLRRKAQLLMMRPDLKIELLRGNVQTRLQKVSDGYFDATLLAKAGLNRLGYADDFAPCFELDIFPPAPAQGAVGIETSYHLNADFKPLIASIGCQKTMIEISAERSFLKTLDGNCRTPIAAYAHILGDILHLTGQLLSEDGTKYAHARDTSPLDKAEHLGNRLGHLVKIKFQSQL